MRRKNSSASITGLIVIIVILALITAVSAIFLLKNANLLSGKMFDSFVMKDAPAPDDAAAEYLSKLDVAPDGSYYTVSTDGSRLYIDACPAGEEAKVFFDGLLGGWSYRIEGYWLDRRSATVDFQIECVDTALLEQPLRELFQTKLKQAVERSERSEEVYDENFSYRPEVIEAAYKEAAAEIAAGLDEYKVTITTSLNLEYKDGKWEITNPATAVNTLDERTAALKAAATANPEYIQKIYTIEEAATAGRIPDQSGFITTSDPAEVRRLLSQPKAQLLMKGQQTVWNENIEFIPGTQIRCYLDESILAIEWQEGEANMVGTFSEVFVADGSQIRRKIAGDEFGSMEFEYATQFAADTNAVIAVGGDLYNHDRRCGIMVYNRDIYRFDPTTADTCYITTAGDMLFSYRDQFETQEQAQQFVDENDVLFSLCFGPVMIDDGEDVTPDSYAWGEINDTYARAALGMMGEHHYLTMNLNCGTGAYYGYATLRQAADAMVERGCVKAYTLDGGQTCCTVVNGELVSPVQFGYERGVSDILYFATSVPED